MCVVIQIMFCFLLLANCIKLASYNVQQFGESKMGKDLVVKKLVEIFRRYDIVFMQEIQDVSDTYLWEFIKKINANLSSSEQYVGIASKRVGEGSFEQYAYIYKPSKLKLIKAFQPNDTYNWFSRRPYGAIFEDKVNPNHLRFFLFGIHDKPSDAYNEIIHFGELYLYLINGSNPEPLTQSDREIILNYGLLMGDLNCGGSYVSSTKENAAIKFYDGLKMNWLIDRSVKTMVESGNPYDRFIASKKFIPLVKNGTVRPLDLTYFNNDLNLAKDCSDHYPIEMVFNWEVKSKQSVDDSSMSFAVHVFVVICLILLQL